MAIVKENPNGDKGTADGMAKYSFSGSPTEQFEHIAEVNETRVMTITVECRASGKETVQDGERTHVKWRVINAELGKRVSQAKSDEPELPYESGANSEYGDYGVAAPPSEDGSDDEVGEDGYTNAERRAEAEKNGDTPTAATESNVRTIQPSFSGAN